ncbi:hypothetical protein PAF17_19010, partial [Paracoccus sp. Z330]
MNESSRWFRIVPISVGGTGGGSLQAGSKILTLNQYLAGSSGGARGRHNRTPKNQFHPTYAGLSHIHPPKSMAFPPHRFT